MTQETISINIKPEAKEIIEKKNPENKPLLLALMMVQTSIQDLVVLVQLVPTFNS